jgi:IclR family acetate operon transcriptional repressor
LLSLREIKAQPFDILNKHRQANMAQAAVTAVERVLDILECFQTAARPLSLTEVSEMAGIPKSSCHAIVGTLVARGYLYSLARPRSLYPTRRLHDVAFDIAQSDPFVQRAQPVLEQLRAASGETVILGKRQGDAVIYLQVLEGPHAIRYSAQAGEFKPLFSSAIGKALLGSMKEPELRALLDAHALPAATQQTLTSRKALTADILASRKRGYFVTRGENVADVWAVAAFVALRNETLGVALAGPAARIEAQLATLAPLLVGACSQLARQVR